MHEMLIILTDVHGVSLSVMHLNLAAHMQCMPRALCAGSFSTAFVKCLWLLVSFKPHFKEDSITSVYIST